MAFTVEASNRFGTQTLSAGSPQDAIDLIADLLNADYTIDRLADRNDTTIDYDDIIRAGNTNRVR